MGWLLWGSLGADNGSGPVGQGSGRRRSARQSRSTSVSPSKAGLAGSNFELPLWPTMRRGCGHRQRQLPEWSSPLNGRLMRTAPDGNLHRKSHANYMVPCNPGGANAISGKGRFSWCSVHSSCSAIVSGRRLKRREAQREARDALARGHADAAAVCAHDGPGDRQAGSGALAVGSAR